MKAHNKLISILLLAMSWQIHVADRALIVGITEYKNIKNLKGIGYDVGMAGKIAEMLAFDPSQIKVLTGKQATKSNIKNAFATWLKEGVSRNDRIFFYFSGHGGRVADKNGDESDGQDEFITTYDITGSVKDGGYIIDDDLSLWLSNIESQHKIVMLDSCNSGTATKSLAIAKMGNLKLYSKLLNLTDNPHSFSSSKNLSDEKGNFIEGAQHQITLSAARDFEEAQATDIGSLFTLGFYNALEQATQKGQSPSANNLVNQAAAFIKENLSEDRDKMHKPGVFGDQSMANQPLMIKVSRNSQGPNWQELKQMARLGQLIKASSNKTDYNEGEVITFNVEIPTSGYLNVLSVDAHDEVTVLYPNIYAKDNHISAGDVKFPSGLMPFEIEAIKPKGDSLTVFVVTTQAINLYKESINVRDFSGKFVKDFAKATEATFRGIGIKARDRNNQTYTAGVKTRVR